jgi:transposase
MSKYTPAMDLKERELRRMESVKRLRAGTPAAQVAEEMGVALNTVYMWGKLARKGGKKALKSVPKSGRPLKLGREHWVELKKMILGSPSDCGFDRELWTLPMIGELIERKYNIVYHDDHLSRLVRRLGLSVQKPAVRARERDEKAVKKFIRTEFPALEKKRGKAAER